MVMDVGRHTVSVRADATGLGMGEKDVPNASLVITPWLFFLAISG